jgi:putative heme-binding domain-containing protein
MPRKTRTNKKSVERKLGFHAMKWLIGCLLAGLIVVGVAQHNSAAEKKSVARASASSIAQTATPVEAIQTLPGFKVERLYSVPADKQGSWVALTVDDKGRLIASDQYGALYRITPPAIGASGEPRVEKLAASIGGAQGLLYAFNSLYVVVNEGREGSERPSGLYRLRDTKGTDQFDEIKLLRRIEGSGEHGPHAVILSPDGKSLYVVAGNFTKVPDPEVYRAPKVWAEDQLLPRMPDGNGFAANIFAPAGWVCRTDPDGKTWELTSIGMRNCYDIAFNADGELFTYDNDMEWDIGLPWYRPTRVLHLASGSDSGWRNGSGKFPVYYPDNLPAAVDIGVGAPTGIVFGYGTKFPAKYQQALYILDWTYGVIYAVHLEPRGSTYEGTFERFVSGQPLPVTDIVVGHDGALYFAIGGRKTQSGLYRVRYMGNESVAPAKLTANPEAEAARAVRRRLEALHGRQDATAVATAWPYLGHSDCFIRWAARTAIECQPVAEWQEKALAVKAPQAPAAVLTAMVALARCGDKALEPRIVAALDRLPWSALDEHQRLELLRAYGLTFARMGKPSADTAATVIAKLDSLFPAKQAELNRELSALLVYLEGPGAVSRTLKLLETSPVQEEQIWCAYVLRTAASGWSSLDERKAYFDWFHRATELKGGHSFAPYLRHMKEEAVSHLTDEDKLALAEVLKDKPIASGPVLPPRAVVKDYKLDDLLPIVQAGLKPRNFERGRTMFAAAMCFRCHRFAGEGGSGGPDLTGIAGRFNAHDLLESIVEPSKVIADQYKASIFTLDDGREVAGRVVNLHGDGISIVANLLAPDDQVTINRHHIESIRPSPISPMPTGLLNTLTQDEVLDLIAFLFSGGDKNHKMFR